MSDSSQDLSIPITDQDHALGPANAPVTLVEYGDYECPDCLNAFPIVKQLIERFGDRLRFVFRHFPQYSIHPHSGVAAQAAEAAGAQGKYWQMHDALFKNQKRLDEIDYVHLALTLGLDPYRFQTEMDGDRARRRVTADRAGAEQMGVKGTPTFFINGKRYRGKNDLESLSEAFNSAL